MHRDKTLKKAILHRKNSWYYRTARGAWAGDLYMTLIHTCNLNRIDPYQYLVSLMRYSDDAACRPADWFPWNYEERLSVLEWSSEDEQALDEDGESPSAGDGGSSPSPESAARG